MKRWISIIVPACVIIISVTAIAASKSRDARKREEAVTAVRSLLPEAVRLTLLEEIVREVECIELEKVKVGRHRGKRVYEIEIEFDGREIELEIDQTGRLIEKEVERDPNDDR